jgi:predicted transposase YdaD
MVKLSSDQVAYHTEEMRLLRELIAQHISSMDKMQYFFMLASGAIYSFFLGSKQEGLAAYILLVPTVLAAMGWLHYEGIRQEGIEIRRYIAKLEEILCGANLGYAKFYISNRSDGISLIRYARGAYWAISIVLSLVIFLAFLFGAGP